MTETFAYEACALCGLKLSDNVLANTDDDHYFCCRGCSVVYQILEAQDMLSQYKTHPVFLEALKSGLIADQTLALSKDAENLVPKADFQKMHLVIDDMWCPSCALVIHLILMKQKGVTECCVDYSTDLATIEYTPRLITKDKIMKLISSMGYVPRPLQDMRSQAISRQLLLRFIVAAFFSLNIMMFSYPIYATYFDNDTEGYASLFAWLSLWGSLPVIFYSGWPIWRRFYHAMKVGVFGMETLVVIGVLAASVLSVHELIEDSPYVYFDSMTVIIVFVLLGKIIESKAKFSAKDALVKLSLALPRKGRKRTSETQEAFVPIKEFKLADELVVRMGEKVVLDGIVKEGEGVCDESVMTGESTLVPKMPGSTVLAGSILQQGYLVVSVTALLEETALHQIIDMVSAQVKIKSQTVRSVDKIVKWFVPFVLILSAVVGLSSFMLDLSDAGKTPLQTAFVRSIAILLISCPCAIGIAVPLVEAYLLNAFAKMGVIVRNRAALAHLGKETLFIFDKTGTVTQGKFEVFSGLDILSEANKQALKALVKQSLHPVSLAINSLLPYTSSVKVQIEEIAGKGIRGTIDGKSYCLGSEVFVLGAPSDGSAKCTKPAEKIVSSVYFACEDKLLTCLELADRLQPGIEELLTALKPLKTLLVSGDSEAPVKKTAHACGFDAWHFGCLPLEKKALVDKFKQEGEKVVMIGDGINDAPALSAAHVGIAVMNASDISTQVSDILLTTKNLHALSDLRLLAQRAGKIMNQNLFWAFFYNVIGLVLASFGFLSPLFAAFAMVMSSLIVLFNAQRVTLLKNE